MTDTLKTLGYPSLDELKSTPGYPGEDIQKKGPVAIIECIEEIPCNPCETSCPAGAIKVGDPITNLPRLIANKCRGCGRCVAACPGLAIYIKDYTYSAEKALITFPYEYFPLPQKGDRVIAVNRRGKPVCEGEIMEVKLLGSYNKTPLVSMAYPREFFEEVVSIKRLEGEG